MTRYRKRSLNYSQCRSIFSQARSSHPKLYHNTHLIKEGSSCFTVLFHDNKILTVRPDDSVLFFATWGKSVTTKARLNQFGPAGYSVYQKKRVWYLAHPDGFQEEFFDGISTNKEENPMRRACALDTLHGRSILRDWLTENDRPLFEE